MTNSDARTAVGRPDGAAEQGTFGRTGSKWWTLTAVCLGTFMLLLDVTIVNVALPDIQAALHSSFSGLQWVVDAYALSLAALLLTAGSLADLYGRRLMYIVGLVIFTLGSALCGAAQSTLMLQLSRGLQGVGGAIMFAVSLALLADAFRGKDRGVAFGVWGAITGVAVAIGPLLGGVLTSGLSWRWIFFVNLPVGIVAVVLTVMRVAESRAPVARRPDWPGFVLFTIALSALVYGLIESSQKTFSSGIVIGCLITAGVLLAAFVVAESRLRQPMFDLSLFRKPTFSGGAVAAFALSASIFAMFLYLVLFLQDVLRFSALGTGLRLLVVSVAILITSAIAGRLTSKVPLRFLIGPGLLLVGAGLLLMRRPDRYLGLDPPAARPDHQRYRHRPGQPAAGVDRRRRGAAPAGRHGLRDQLHVPPGRHRYRNRAAGHPVRQPDPGLRIRARAPGWPGTARRSRRPSSPATWASCWPACPPRPGPPSSTSAGPRSPAG